MNDTYNDSEEEEEQRKKSSTGAKESLPPVEIQAEDSENGESIRELPRGRNLPKVTLPTLLQC